MRAVLVASVLSACGGEPDSADVDDTAEPLVVSVSGCSARGTYTHYSFTRTAGYRYTVCIYPTSGDADLYASASGAPTTSSFDLSSTHPTTTPDCVTLTATTSGTEYVSVYGWASGSSCFSYYRTYTDNAYVPAWLGGRLTRPFSGFSPTGFTHPTYGPFNSPWGNASYAPFYASDAHYIHNGADYAAAPGTAIRAGCAGSIKKVGDLGCRTVGGASCTGGAGCYCWGKFALLECSFPSGATTQTVTLAYDHLAPTGLPSSRACPTPSPACPVAVTAGATIGSVADLTFPGELDHLHFGICVGSVATCNGPAQGGARRDDDTVSVFPGPMISPSPSGLYAP